MTAVISDFSWVNDAWREFVSRRLLKPRRECRHIMNVRFDGVGTLTGLLEIFLVVSDYTSNCIHLSLSMIIWPVFHGLGSRWNPIIWSDCTITAKIMNIIWSDYLASWGGLFPLGTHV